MGVYISGAITGTDDYMERFKKVEDRLTKEGVTVMSPASVMSNMPEDTAYEEYMKVAFCLLGMYDAIYMMKDWEGSRGANREYGYVIGKGMEMMFEGVARGCGTDL